MLALLFYEDLRSLVWPKGGSKRPAVVFIGAKGGGFNKRPVKFGNHGKMASRIAFKTASALAASSALNSLELFWLLNSAPNSWAAVTAADPVEPD